MGQQQLLLIVMGVIVVGIAVVAGSDIMDNQLRKNAVNNLTDRGIAIATQAIHWKMKSDPFSGGDASFGNLSFSNIGLSPTTSTGTFNFSHALGDELQITALSNRFNEIGIRIYITDYSIDSTVVAYDGSIILE